MVAKPILDISDELEVCNPCVFDCLTNRKESRTEKVTAVLSIFLTTLAFVLIIGTNAIIIFAWSGRIRINVQNQFLDLVYYGNSTSKCYR